MTIFWFVPKADFWREGQFHYQAWAKPATRGKYREEEKQIKRKKRAQKEKKSQYSYCKYVHAAATT